MLLDAGAEINTVDNEGTALAVAVVHGQKEAVKLLLERKAEYSTIHVAAFIGDEKMVKKILNENIGINNKDDDGNRRALYFASLEGQDKIVKLLIEFGVDINTKSKYFPTPLEAAAGKGYINTVKLLTQNRAKIGEGVIEASLHGHLEVAKLLIAKGADVNTKNKYSETALNFATEKGHKDIVELLMQNGADITAKNKYGANLVHSAASSGNMELVKLFLDKGVNWNAKSYNQKGILHFAVHGGNVEIVKLFLDKGADVNHADKNKYLPLTEACIRDSVDIARLLIDNGTKVNGPKKDSEKPLYHAVRAGKVKIAKLLIEKGAEISPKKVPSCFMPIHAAISHDKIDCLELLIKNSPEIDMGHLLVYAAGEPKVSMVEYFLGKGVAANSKGKWGNTALHEASINNDLIIANILLKAGADINIKNNNSESVLYCALISHRVKNTIDIFKYLIENGVDVNAKNREGSTCLQMAAAGCKKEQVELLIEAGADVNAIGAMGKTALHWAVARLFANHNNEEVIKILLDNGAKLEVKDTGFGQTPLGTAATFGNIDAIRLLVDKGADLNVVDKHGRTPQENAISRGCYDVQEFLILKQQGEKPFKLETVNALVFTAARHGQVKLLERLIKEGADVNYKDAKFLMTPLHMACQRQYKGVVEVLVKNGANLNIKGRKGKTALHFLTERINDYRREEEASQYPLKIVRLLLDNGANVNAVDEILRTPLHYAVRQAVRQTDTNYEVIVSLIEAGANVNAVNKRGLTPMQIAKNKKDDKLLQAIKAALVKQ